MASSSEPTRVHFRRTGGIFAGNRIELDVSQDELDPAGVEALARVLDNPALTHELPGQGGGADEYQYDLTIHRGDEVVSLRFDESRLPPELVPLIEALEQRALERPERQTGWPGSPGPER